MIKKVRKAREPRVLLGLRLSGSQKHLGRGRSVAERGREGGAQQTE